MLLHFVSVCYGWYWWRPLVSDVDYMNHETSSTMRHHDEELISLYHSNMLVMMWPPLLLYKGCTVWDEHYDTC